MKMRLASYDFRNDDTDPWGDVRRQVYKKKKPKLDGTVLPSWVPPHDPTEDILPEVDDTSLKKIGFVDENIFRPYIGELPMERIFDEQSQWWLSSASGARKASKAVVRVRAHGTGEVLINGKYITEYFPFYTREILLKVLRMGDSFYHYDFFCYVKGGGHNGQAGALRLAIAKAIRNMNPDYQETFKKNKLLTRDRRTVERKKPGSRKARRKPQWVKR